MVTSFLSGGFFITYVLMSSQPILAMDNGEPLRQESFIRENAYLKDLNEFLEPVGIKVASSGDLSTHYRIILRVHQKQMNEYKEIASKQKLKVSQSDLFEKIGHEKTKIPTWGSTTVEGLSSLHAIMKRVDENFNNFNEKDFKEYYESNKELFMTYGDAFLSVAVLDSMEDVNAVLAGEKELSSFRDYEEEVKVVLTDSDSSKISNDVQEMKQGETRYVSLGDGFYTFKLNKRSEPELYDFEAVVEDIKQAFYLKELFKVFE